MCMCVYRQVWLHPFIYSTSLDPTNSNSMEQSSSCEADNGSASQEICHPLHELQIWYCVHNRMSLATILNHMKPVNNFSNIYFLSSFQIFALKLCMPFLSPYACSMSWPTHPRSDNSSHMW